MVDNNAARLPYEILLDTFKYLAHFGLLQLQLTYKQWGNVAQDITYTKINVKDRSEDSDLMKSVGTITVSRHKSNKDLGKLVSAVDFTNVDSDTVLAASLRFFGLLCPSIQTILVEYADEAFYKSLYIGNFEKLTTMPIPICSRSKPVEAYKNALIAMRSNVENFVLCDITRDTFDNKLIDPASLKYLKRRTH
jgi:hypothetical protein